MHFTPIDIHLTPNDNHRTIYGTIPQVNKEFSWGHHLLFSIQWNLLCQYGVTYPYYRGTLRSRHGAGVDFDKICVFCGKFCIHIDKCVFIVVKIKCVNSGKISDICDKVNFTTNYTYFTTSDNILSKHT